MPAKIAQDNTSGGAEAIRLVTRSERSPSRTRADCSPVSLEDLHFTPLYDLVSHLVCVADEQDVVSVVVDGKVLMRGARFSPSM